MKIVLTCGHPNSGFESLHELLVMAGLADAKPSPRKMVSAAELHAAIFDSLELPQDGLNVPTQQSPDAAMQEIAVALFLDNAGQEKWGWADARSVWLLDFWCGFDPQTRFVLVYSAPEIVLGQVLRNSNALSADVEKLIDSWKENCTEILRFYHRNRNRCVLVDAGAAISEPARLVEDVSNAFDLKFDKLKSENVSIRPGLSAIASQLAQSLLEGRDEIFALYRELESSADFVCTSAMQTGARARDALQEYSDLLEAVRTASIKLDQCSADRERLVRECVGFQEQLVQSEQEALRLNQASKTADSVVLEVSTRLQQLQSMNATLTQDSHIHELQLKQVQEESGHYFSKVQELSRAQQQCLTELAAHRRFWLAHQPAEIVMDLRDEIDGENWYYPEKDGRWAGPGPVSTIRLPRLRPGRYKLQLDVVDAMEPEILAGLEIALDGALLALKHQGKRYPSRVFAEFSADEFASLPIWEFQFKFPKLVCPAQLGSNDQRTLAIRVQFATFTKID